MLAVCCLIVREDPSWPQGPEQLDLFGDENAPVQGTSKKED